MKGSFKKINAELEQLSDDELEKVAGGYQNEVSELSEAIHGKGKYLSAIPGVSEIEKQNIKSILEKKLNIKADLSIGGLGWGIFSSQNTYKDLSTGKSLTHQEVLDRIKLAKGSDTKF